MLGLGGRVFSLLTLGFVLLGVALGLIDFSGSSAVIVLAWSLVVLLLEA